MALDLKRALTDQTYVDSLTPEERKELLEKAKELGDAELERIAGGMKAQTTPSTTKDVSCTRSVRVAC